MVGRCTAAARLGSRLVGGLGEGSAALQNTAPQPVLWAPSSAAGPGLGKLKGLREKAGIHLLPHAPPHDHHSPVA